MSEDSILYLAVGKLAKDGDEFLQGQHKLITRYSKDPKNRKEYYNHIKDIMDKAPNKLTPKKRFRLSDEKYDLHVKADSLEDNDELIIFFVVTGKNFGANQSVSKLFEQFQNNFFGEFSVPDIIKSKEKGDIHKRSQNMLENIVENYSGHSKLKEAQNVVKNVTDKVNEGMKQVLINDGKLTDLSAVADNLEEEAEEFRNDTKQLRKQMACRNYKITAVMVLLTVSVLGLIVLALAG